MRIDAMVNVDMPPEVALEVIEAEHGPSILLQHGNGWAVIESRVVLPELTDEEKAADRKRSKAAITKGLGKPAPK